MPAAVACTVAGMASSVGLMLSLIGVIFAPFVKYTPRVSARTYVPSGASAIDRWETTPTLSDRRLASPVLKSVMRYSFPDFATIMYGPTCPKPVIGEPSFSSKIETFAAGHVTGPLFAGMRSEKNTREGSAATRATQLRFPASTMYLPFCNVPDVAVHAVADPLPAHCCGVPPPFIPYIGPRGPLTTWD